MTCFTAGLVAGAAKTGAPPSHPLGTGRRGSVMHRIKQNSRLRGEGGDGRKNQFRGATGARNGGEEGEGKKKPPNEITPTASLSRHAGPPP